MSVFHWKKNSKCQNSQQSSILSYFDYLFIEKISTKSTLTVCEVSVTKTKVERIMVQWRGTFALGPILFVWTSVVVTVTGFGTFNHHHVVVKKESLFLNNEFKMSFTSENDIHENWISLLSNNDDFSVKKRILVEGDGATIPCNGDIVEIDYVGTLVGDAPLDWTVDNVVDCWLTHQQGLQELIPTFQKEGIDGKQLLDDTYFTEDFISTTLGVDNKIRCKKLAMASRRLAKEVYTDGYQFDSNAERGGPYSFTVGKKKVIAAMELAIPTMKVGETAQIITLSNYAYGPEGYRKPNGDVMVPPFATLRFDITLLSCQSP